ncbi:MAG: hypothetical protein CM15mP74_16160 [Halieaceae bacterium]|nr:MAG: hypothetical protein CM15mP74_16160 [Halieaceae bacterium]
MDTLALSADTRALDVGCGCGQPSLSLARRIGPGGTVTGIDISAPMLALARSLANQESVDSAPVNSSRQMRRSMPLNRIPLTCLFRDSASCSLRTPSRLYQYPRCDVFAGKTGFLLLATAGPQSVYDVPAMAALELLPAPAEVPPRSPGPSLLRSPTISKRFCRHRDSVISPSSQSAIPWFRPGTLSGRDCRAPGHHRPIAQMVREAPIACSNRSEKRWSPRYHPLRPRHRPHLDGEFWQVTASR